MDPDALIRDFYGHGLLIVAELFDPAKVVEIERELIRYIGQMDRRRSDVVYEPGTDRKIRNVFHMHQDDEYFASLAREPRLLNLVKGILNDEPLLMTVELFAKPARVGSEVPYHQDNAYFNLTPDDALTVWLALADSIEENGCVRYLDGSHKLGNLPHRPSGVKGNSMGLCEVPSGSWREVAGVVRRGGAVIHHCNTIHRSEPNRSDRDRPGLLFVYKAARCRVDESRAARYREVAAALR